MPKTIRVRIPSRQAMASNRCKSIPGPQAGRRRKRTKYNKDQYKVLIEAFERNPYPDFSKREELSELTQIPKSRIQVWFQNRRARISKKNKKNLGKKVAPEHVSISDPELPGIFFPNYFGQSGLPGSQRKKGCVSHESDHASYQVTFWDHTGGLGLSMVCPDLETLDSMPRPPSGNFYCPFLGPDEFPPALQKPFPNLEAEGTGTQVCLETPRLLLHGDPALQGSEEHPCSEEPQSLWDRKPPLPAEEPKAPFGYPGAWEQPESSLYQLPWPKPVSVSLQWPQPLQVLTAAAEGGSGAKWSSCLCGMARSTQPQCEPLKCELCITGYYHCNEDLSNYCH